jgi:hypothetical protein
VDAVPGAALEGVPDAHLEVACGGRCACAAAADEEDDLDHAWLEAVVALLDADADRHAAADREAAEAGVQAQRGARRGADDGPRGALKVGA